MKILTERGYSFTTSAEREIVRDIKEKAALNLKRANLLRYRFTTLKDGKLAFISAEHAIAYRSGSLQSGYSLTAPCPSGAFTRSTSASLAPLSTPTLSSLPSAPAHVPAATSSLFSSAA